MKENIASRFTVDTIATLYVKFGNRFLAGERRSKLNDTSFSIISNNCWGGSVYRHFGLPYSFPTVGTYFYSEEYIHLLSDIEKNIHLPLTFINAEESKYSAHLRAKSQMNVPVGLLGNSIEVVFLHYSTPEEAYEKWNRRLDRLNTDNLIVKFSQMNLCENRHLQLFEQMPYRKKLLFISKAYEGAPSGIAVKRYTNDHQVTNDTLYYWKNINLVKLING